MGPARRRHLVAVVAPQILPGALAHQLLERAVEAPRRRLAGQRPAAAGAARSHSRGRAAAAARRRGRRHDGSRSASFAASVMVYAGRPKNSAHSPSPSPGTWSGRRPIDVAALQSAANSSRTPLMLGGREAQVVAAAALAHQRLEPGELGRPVQHADRTMLRGVLRTNLEAAQVRRENRPRPPRSAAKACAEPSTLAHQRRDLSMRPEPQRRQLGQHLSGRGDRPRRMRASR